MYSHFKISQQDCKSPQGQNVQQNQLNIEIQNNLKQFQQLCNNLNLNLVQLKNEQQEVMYQQYCQQINEYIKPIQQYINIQYEKDVSLIQSQLGTTKKHLPKQPVSIAFEIMFMPTNKDNLITQETKDFVYSCDSLNRQQQILLSEQILQNAENFEQLYQQMHEIENSAKNDMKSNISDYNSQTTPIIRQSPIAHRYSYIDEESGSLMSEPILSDNLSTFSQHQDLRERVKKSQERHKNIEQQQMEKINEQMEKIKQKTEKIKQQKILYAIQIKEKAKEQTLRGIQKKHEIEQQKIQQARMQLLKVEKAKQKREQQKHELFEKIQRNMIENDTRRRKYMENKQEKLHTTSSQTECQLQQVLWSGYSELFSGLENGEFLQLLSETTDCQEIQLILNNFQLYNNQVALNMTKEFLDQKQNQQRPDYLYILFYAVTYSLFTSNQYYQRNIDYNQNSYEYQIVFPQQQSDSVYQIPGILYESQFLQIEYIIIKNLMNAKNQQQQQDSLQFYYYKLSQFENQVKNEIQIQFIQQYASCLVLQDITNNLDEIFLNILVYVLLQKVDYPMVVSEKYISQMKISKPKQKWIYDQLSSCQYALEFINIIIKNGIELESEQLIKYYELLNSQAAQIVLSKATYASSQQQVDNINVQSETLYSEYLSLLQSLLQQINFITLLLQDKLVTINNIDYNTTKQELLIILQNLFSRKIIYNENLIEVQQKFEPRNNDIFKFQTYQDDGQFQIQHDDQRFLFEYQQQPKQQNKQLYLNEQNICSSFIIESLYFAINVGKLIQYPYQFFEDVIQNIPPQCIVSKKCCQIIRQLADATNYTFNYEQNLIGIL